MNLSLDITDSAVVKYVRGINLIASVNGGTYTYYSFNAHGDVIGLTNSSGTVTKIYRYDAFGVEINLDTGDVNVWRYCGEYWDAEAETVYLRARYYNPGTGSFTSKDIYWNSENSVYGDSLQNPLGLGTCTPNFVSIMQGENLHAYGID